MRMNLPVTNREYRLKDDALIVSKTDLKGVITYANADFVEASGFTEAELMGQPHNLLRHPDMPAIAFADLWATLQRGKPWTGIVKNRRKNGDHYWVVANATPLYDQGRVCGYMSMRTAASREQIDFAENLYRDIREGRCKFKLHEGELLEPGIFAAIRRTIHNLSFRSRLGGLIALFCVLLLALNGASLMMLSDSEAQAQVEGERSDRLLLSLKELRAVEFDWRSLVEAAMASPSALNLRASTRDAIERRFDTLAAHFKAEGIAPEPLDAARSIYRGMAERAGKNGAGPTNPAELRAAETAFKTSMDSLYQLLDLQLRNHQIWPNQTSAENFRHQLNLAVSSLVMTLIIGFLTGEWVLRGICKPLQYVIDEFGALTHGELGRIIKVTHHNEIGTLLEGLKSLQTRLGFEESEKIRFLKGAVRVQQGLDNTSSNVMIIDNQDYKILYLNRSLKSLFISIEAKIRETLPQFRAGELVGGSVNQLGEIQVLQRQALNALKVTDEAEVVMGDHTFVIAATPVVNEDGELIGTVVEWRDRTHELIAEREVGRLVSEASAGRLSERANLELLPQGFLRDTGCGINRLLDSVTGPFNAVAGHLDAISRGDIPPPIQEQYHGEFDRIKRNLNRVIDAVNLLVSDAQLLHRAATDGQLEVRADAAHHDGKFREIVEGFNQTLNAMAVPIEEVVRVLSALAQGDLTQQITASYRGVFGQLRDDVNSSVGQLNASVAMIKEATIAINSAAKEIAAGNSDLSHRTETQASSLEETTTSMDELSTTVRQNADNAMQANQMAVAASDVAARGGDVVQRVVGTMSDINERSRRVVDIISVIDGIAFQTNILALNAAVEAARAGEQGRGFAVVAGEVRTLAQRSAAAAREIKELINASVERVEDGTRQVEEAGETMGEVVTSVRRVTDIMAEIASASSEQSHGILQVNQAITQMDEVTQQNAALVEQAAAAAESLEEQAANLAVAVARFRIGDESGLAPSRRPTAAAPTTALARPKPSGRSLGAKAVNGSDEWTEF